MPAQKPGPGQQELEHYSVLTSLTSSHVSHLCRIAVTIIDQEGDEPPAFRHLSTLIGEDEKGSDQRRPVVDGSPEHLQLGRLTSF